MCQACLTNYTKAYNILERAMVLCGWSHLYSKVHLHSDAVYEILYYAETDPEHDYPLCCIIRGILFDQVPELYQTLK